MTALRKKLLADLAQAEAHAAMIVPHAILAACDLAYARHLLGQPAFETPAEFQHHLNRLHGFRLAGAADDERPGLSVHLTAYVLASLALAGAAHRETASAFVRSITSDWRQLLHPESLMPRWPRRYSHHSWRVGHWVGGAPAILRLQTILAPDVCAALPPVAKVLQTCDALIDPRTGLLRTWRSPAIQSVFRQAYRLRHDPDAGALGGVAHLHWINHAEGRTPYKAADALFHRAWKLMQRRPFVERAPYCLDFDVVQIVRTSAAGPMDDAVRLRAGDYAADIAAFLLGQTDPTSYLHRLPGALATLHECALIRGEPEAAGLGTPAIDIIKDAGWL